MIPTLQSPRSEEPTGQRASSGRVFSGAEAYEQYVRDISTANIQAAAQGPEVQAAQDAVFELYDQIPPSPEVIDQMLAEDRAQRAAEARRAVEASAVTSELNGEARTIATIECLSPAEQAARIGQVAAVLDSRIRNWALQNPERVDFTLAA